MYDGIKLVELPELNKINMYSVMHLINEAEDVSDNYKETFSSYCQTMFDQGFLIKWSTISQQADYQQDIVLFFTADEAERALSELPRLSADTLFATIKELGIEIECEIVDINPSELGPDSCGISIIMHVGHEKRYLNIVVNRERNVVSAITTGSYIMSSSPYSDGTPDDAILLSKQALEKIRSQLADGDILVPTPKSTSFLNLLKLIPAALVKENENTIIMNDYAMIRELFDAAIPDTFTDKDIEEYMKSMYGYNDDFDYMSGMGRGSFISGHDIFSTSTPIRLENVGYNLFNVDADIYTDYTANYTQTHAAVIGRFNPVATREAMDNQTEWPEAVRDSFTFEDYRDTRIYSWGNGDFGENNTLMPPLLDRLGRSFPFAVTLTNVFYSDTLTNIKLMIDSIKGAIISLADIPEYYAAASGLSELGAYSGIIGDESSVNSADFQRDESGAPPLRPYLTFGTGIGRDILGPYMALALVHDSAEAASANAEILVERVNGTSWIAPVDWENFWRLYVDYIQVSVEGNVVSAKLYGDRAQYIWKDWIYECNPFLLHE